MKCSCVFLSPPSAVPRRIPCRTTISLYRFVRPIALPYLPHTTFDIWQQVWNMQPLRGHWSVLTANRGRERHLRNRSPVLVKENSKLMVDLVCAGGCWNLAS